MKRTKPKVISTSFFKLYKSAHYFNNIDPAEYLLYSIGRDQEFYIIYLRKCNEGIGTVDFDFLYLFLNKYFTMAWFMKFPLSFYPN